LKDFFSRLSWADYIALAVMARGVYVGYKSGVFSEFLRILAYLVTFVAAFKLHDPIAQQLTLNTFLNGAAARVAAFAAVFVPAFVATFVVRKLVLQLLKAGEGGVFQKILGAVLGACRWIAVLSLLYMAIDQSPLKQLQTDVHERSLTGQAVSRVAPALFGFLVQVSPPSGEGGGAGA
jgi:uncharacterized membrane protein required for colicin V production